MMKNIADKIGAYGFSDFKIIEVRSRENQLYLLKEKIEARRAIESRYYDITVYADHKSTDTMLRGEYNFIYKPSADLDFYLEQARFACSLIKNRYYDLVSAAESSNVNLFDSRMEDAAATGAELTETIYRSVKNTNVHLSSAEIYLKRSEITLLTSTGVELSKHKGLIEIEITLIGKKGKNEQEMNFHLKRRRIEDLRLQQRIEEYTRHTINTLNARVPPSGKAHVVIDGSDVYGLMSPIIYHSSGKAKDQGMTRFRPGERIIGRSRSDFTLKTSGVIPFGLYSDPFDDDGIAGQEHTIIERGIFKKHWATKRYADYLSIEPTGSFKNLVIEPEPGADSADDNYYEIVQFSDLSPDPVTGDLVAEIRFGYHTKNKKKMPIKGGSVGCNVFEALQNAYFSGENTFEGRYFGPNRVVLKGLSISGE
jgi:predicted Zn-dependent protease